MLEHLSERDLTRYRNRELSPAEVLGLDKHLANCASCQAEIRLLAESAETTTQVVTALRGKEPEDDHLSYEQMADYVENASSSVEREICDSHLEFCGSCHTEVIDLLAMKAKLAELPDTRYSPREAPRVWDRLATWWQLPSIRIPVLAAAGAVIVALLAWAVILDSRKKSEQARIQAGKLEKVAAATPAPSPTDSIGPQDQNVRLVVELIDGDGKVSLDSQDKLLGLESAPLQIQNEVRSALKSERVNAPPFVTSLKGETGRLMGGNRADYGLHNPVATAVESATPTFRWNAVKSAENYTVTIYDAGSKKVLTSEPVLKNIWKANSALQRGRTYSWQVRAIKDGREVVMPPPAAPEAKFRIIERNKLQEIQLARKSHAKSSLVLGVVYAEAGLLDEAEREFRKLLDANPKSPVAQSLLRSVKSLRR